MTHLYKEGDIEYVQVRFLPKFETIVIYWPNMVPNSKVGKACCHLIVDVVNHHCPKFMINDNRGQTGAWPDMGKWLMEVWIPALANGGVKYYAHVFSPSMEGQLSVKSLFSDKMHGISFMTFFNSTAAVRWLEEKNAESIDEGSKPNLFSEFGVSKTIINELKEANHFLAAATKKAHMGIWRLNLLSKELIVNDIWLNLHHLDEKSHKKDSSVWKKAVHPIDLPLLEEKIQLASEGKDVESFTYRIKANGIWRYLKTSFEAIWSEDKEQVAKVLGIEFDITDDLLKQNELKKLVETNSTLFQELHHRVKNNLNMIASILIMKQNLAPDPVLRDFIEDTKNRIHAVANVHDLFYIEEELHEVSGKTYFENLLDNLLKPAKTSGKNYELDTDIQEVKMSIDRLIPLGLIINEIVTNTIKHAFPDQKLGTIYLSLHKDANKIELQIGDNGVGIDRQPEKTNTLGINIVKLLVKQLDAEMLVDSKGGMLYTIIVPIDI